MIPSPEELTNDLLVDLHRSLARYIAEVSAWRTDSQQPLEAAIGALAERQQCDTQLLFNALLESGILPDPGVYPADYSALHFVSLDYLLPRIVSGQTELVRDLDQLVTVATGDPVLEPAARAVAESQRAGLAALQQAVQQSAPVSS